MGIRIANKRNWWLVVNRDEGLSVLKGNGVKVVMLTWEPNGEERESDV
jgi:hypothetical protein